MSIDLLIAGLPLASYAYVLWLTGQRGQLLREPVRRD
jgi:hypothetical protein